MTTKATTRKAPDKPPPVTVTCDDLALTVDGKTFYPHRGEVLTFHPLGSVGEAQARRRFALAAWELAQAEQGTDPDAQQRAVVALDAACEEMVARVAPRLVSWTWTGSDGTALPQPDGTAAQLMALSTEELAFVLRASAAKE